MARWLINKGIETDHFLTNLDINKLVYFAHGFHYRLLGKGLVRNVFDVWKYGPVSAVLYHSYKTYENRPIADMQLIPESISEEDKKFLNNFWNNFALQYTTAELIAMSHSSEGAWAKAKRKKISSIPDEYIQEDFKNSD